MKRHVLVARASGAAVERIEHFFSDREYQVDVVQGGVECQEAIKRMAPDALILDWDLPWGGGAGVLGRMQRFDEVVGQTGNKDYDARRNDDDDGDN